MNLNRWNVGWLIIAGALVAAIFLLHQDNVKRRAEVRDLHVQNETVVRLRDENRRTRELLTQAETAETDANEALHLELLKLRAETAELEGKERAASVGKSANVRAPVAARDPEKELARLEDFRDVGRATPAAAVQTMVWAAMKGDDRALVAALSITGAAREKAEALLARIPEVERTKYAGPESLAALVVTGEILDASAAQVLGTTFIDAQHAVVGVRPADSAHDENLSVELGADGWKITVPAKMIDKLKKRIDPTPAVTSPAK